jgi:hypothetical protein
VDWQTLFSGLIAILTGAGGCILVIREVTRRDRAAMRHEMAELSDDVTVLRADLVACRRYAFELAEELARRGGDPPMPPALRSDEP